MKQSVLIPVTNQGFELHYLNNENRPHGWPNKYNESSENFSQLESLFQLHRHDVLEVLVFINGECDFFCEGKTYSLKRGDVVVIPPYAVHKANIKRIEKYERVIISVSEHLMDDFLMSSPLMKENIVNQKTESSHVLHLQSKSFEAIISLLDDINNRLVNDEKNYSFTLNYQLFQTLQIIFDPASRRQNLNSKNALDERFASILEYIELHLTEPDLSLDTISSFFHLNKYYFSHYFKRNMNLPFYRYVSLKRLSFAVTMIKQNQMSIEKVALTCGFPDYSSFYRLFKKEYNLSPKNFQNEYKKRY
ncbi:AraC family transcriptional regulator [Bacillus sp. FJAT-50079]|uniref:helix-turn-helix domain-containing protein n=1 Tax=Bacillus sp. FJAT-50079 TaxID=2833577 RepID=UPI001BCA64BC|nr:AraC family transcriptional regulator [Bacillus sp. FJAT-50079]MBS4210502.1 helix-turn-helix domain-containing protein [Bacillus sp. FJAT-50079]